MKHIGRINPYSFGLLGGLAAWANTMEKYNLMNAQEEAITKRERARYGAMADVQTLKAKNDALLKRLQMEANQRSYTGRETDASGKTFDVSYRNVYNPETGQFEPHETGRVPYESKMDIAKQSQQAMADRMSATQSAAADRLAAREDAIDRRSAAREAARDRAGGDKDRRTKLGQAEQQTNADMREFHKATPDEQAALLNAAGVSVDAPDPDARGFFGGKKEGATKANPDAAKQYRDAMLKQHKSELGLDDAPSANAPASPAAPGSAPPSFTPNGQQIKYDASGNAFIKGPDGKPVPYTPGGDAPLAMDMPDDDMSMPDEGLNVPEPGAEPAERPAALLAGADDESVEPTPDDEDAEGQTGLLGGQYA